MPSVEEKKVHANGYRLHVLESKKYKTTNVVIKLKAPLNKETITSRAILPYILQQGTASYPTARELRKALDYLYGAVLSVDGSKKGESHIITLRLEVANEAFLAKEETIFESALQLMNEILFQPKTLNNGFDPKIVNREKQTLTQKIESIVDDKMSFANMRLIDEMCKEEPYRLHVHGYKEDLKAITAESLYQYYQSLLANDEMDIYVLGDLEGKNVEGLIGQYFTREQPSEANHSPAISGKRVEDVQTIIEKQDIQQGKLHLGYRTNITYQDSDYFALQVFNGIFGGFPSSKLFMNVREKHSLAYYAASRFESHKGLLLVFSGIAPKDYDQAREIINEQMALMKKGDYSDEQVEETKELVINQLLETMDHPQGIIEILYHQVLADREITVEEMMQQIKKVSKEDLVKVAEKIELDTVYFLTSKGGNNNE